MKRLTMVFAAACLIGLAATAHAEKRWGFDLRTGGGPSQDPDQVAMGAGWGFEGTFQYRFMPHLGAYAGWDWVRFPTDDSFAGTDMDFEETGYVFGLRFEHPFSGELGTGPAWWVRAGGTYDHIEIENPDGDIVVDSGHGLGWEAGTGLAFALGTNWSLTPGARYRSLSRDMTISGAVQKVDLSYVLFEVGLTRSF